MVLLIFSIVYYHNLNTVQNFLKCNSAFFKKNSCLILIVNNTIDDISFLNSDNINVIDAGKNLGYFGAARIALNHVLKLELPFDWFIHLNSDLEFAKFNFCDLIKYEESRSYCIMPRITESHTGIEQNPLYYRKPSLNKIRFLSILTSSSLLFNFYANFKKIFRLKPKKSNNSKGSYYAPHGAFICLNRTAISSGVDFHHPSFLFCEEISLGEQIKRNGVTLVYDESIHILHDEHDTTGKDWRSSLLCKYHNASLKMVIKEYY